MKVTGALSLPLVAFAVPALLACGQTVDIGSNIVWHAENEGGNLSEWTADGAGGTMSPAPGVIAGPAHSGTFAVHLGINNAMALWRQGTFPTDAYYSAWFYLPRNYQQITSWTIMTFGIATGTADAGTRNELTILNLRTLPGGEIVLFEFDNRLQYLQWRPAAPPAVVPVAQWFQIEVFYRNANDDTGRITVWLDGTQVYDIPNRPSGATPDMYWGFGNIPDVVSPGPPEIYMDDAVISLSRVTPRGVLGPPSSERLDASPGL